jgi:PEP-CTERM motif
MTRGCIEYSIAVLARFRHALGVTGTDTTPTSTAPPGGPNSANFYGLGTGYAVTGSQTYSSSQNYLTDIGAYLSSPSPYGTFAQGGNVSEWDEALIGGSGAGTRGGWFSNASDVMLSSSRLFTLISRSTELNSIGFRIAAVPEPSTLVLGVLAALMVGGVRRIRSVPTCLRRFGGFLRWLTRHASLAAASMA